MRQAFTIVELLVVVAITLIIAVAAVPIYGNLQISAQLSDNTAQIIQTIRIARTRSVAGVNNSAHGVYFEINSDDHDQYVLYQGSSYAARDAEYDREITLNHALSLATTFVGDEVNFSRGLGLPNATGTITLIHKTDGLRVMTINQLGVVD